jgi:hypothetical protein
MAAADFSVSKFKGALSGGGARPSLFEFTITGVPTGVGTGLDNINFYCQVSALPPLTVTPIEKMYFGRTVKIPGDIVFGDLSTTIYQTESGTERLGVEKWMDLINGHVSNVSGLEGSTADFMGKYSAKGTLTQYAKDGTTTLSTVEFVDMWPQSVTEIPLSYDTASDIEQFDVTWSYNHYTTKIGTTKYI